MVEKKDEVKMILRIDRPIHGKLVTLAKQEKRSLNSQIVYLLQKSLK